MSRISDLMLRVGEAQGNRELARGQGRAALISSVAGFLPGVRAREQASQDRASQQRLMDARLRSEDAQTNNATDQIRSRQHADWTEDQQRVEAQRVLKFNDFLTEVASAQDPEIARAAYEARRPELIQQGVIHENDTPAFFPGMSWVKGAMMRTAPVTERIKALFPQAEPFTLGKGQVRYGANGEVIAQGPQDQPDGFTLTAGQRRFGPDGKEIAAVPQPPETYTLGPGQRRFEGGAVVAEGPPQREPQGPQPEWVTLVSQSGEQRQVPKGQQANALLSQGWRQYDATTVRNEPARAQLLETQKRRADEGLAIVDSLISVGADGSVSPRHPGLDRAFGSVQGALPDVHGDAVDVRAAVDRLSSLITLPEMQSLRGLGPASDRDVRIVESGATMLRNARISDQQARTELKRIREALSRLSTAGAASGGQFSAQAPDGQTYTFQSQQQLDAFKRAAGIP